MQLLNIALSVGLLTIVVAIPSPSRHSQLSTVEAQHLLAEHSLGDVCWKACFPEALDCPDPFKPKAFGVSEIFKKLNPFCWGEPCNTCCLENADDSSEGHLLIGSHSPQPKEIAIPAEKTQGPCLMICAAQEIRCPSDGWESKQFGECWTCCRKEDADAFETSVERVVKSEVAHTDDELTLESPTQNLVPDIRTTAKDYLSQAICLKVCWPQTPECPGGWYSNNFGTADDPCWTCCKAPELASPNVGSGHHGKAYKALAGEDVHVDIHIDMD